MCYSTVGCAWMSLLAIVFLELPLPLLAKSFTDNEPVFDSGSLSGARVTWKTFPPLSSSSMGSVVAGD